MLAALRWVCAEKILPRVHRDPLPQPGQQPVAVGFLGFLVQNRKFNVSRKFREVLVSNDDTEGFLMKTLLLRQLFWGS